MFIRQRNHPNHTFKNWLKSPIGTINGLVYDDNDVCEEDCYCCHISRKPITHRDFVNSVYEDLLGIINKNGYTITYKKSFRIKLAKILYSLSDNSSYGPTL
jgi:hypothetical protein